MGVLRLVRSSMTTPVLGSLRIEPNIAADQAGMSTIRVYHHHIGDFQSFICRHALRREDHEVSEVRVCPGLWIDCTAQF